MADGKGPGETGTGPHDASAPPAGGNDLEARSRALEDALKARRPAAVGSEDKPATGNMTGIGQAMKLSSEFIAGVAVGAGIGWLIDRMAGTSPWGLIIFLLLGFLAGVLNVLRSAGVVAEPARGPGRNDADRRK